MTDLQFGLLPESGSAAVFQLFSASREPDRWTIHARGAIRCGLPADDTAGAWPVSLAAARKACATKRDVDRHYTDFIARGLDFGPAFRGIDELWVGENAALAYILPPAALAAARGGYLIHPAFLDACFQVLGVLLPTPVAGDNSAPVYLPIALAHMQFFKIPKGPVWSFGRLGRSPGDQDGQLDGEISIFDGNGELIAQLSGLRLMATPRDKMLTAHQRTADDFLYEIVWQPKPLKEVENERGLRDATWIIFGNENGVRGCLAKLLDKTGGRCVLVSCGDRFVKIDESHYQIDPTQPADFRRLLDLVTSSPDASEVRLIHLFALDSTAPEPRDEMPPSESQRVSCGSALHIVQALAGADAQRRLRLWLVTCGSRHIAGATEAVDAFQAPLWGLGGVIALEHPELNCTRIDLDPSGRDVENAADLLREILSGGGSDDEIAFRRSTRYVPRLAALRQPSGKKSCDPGNWAVDLKPPDNGLIDNLAFKSTFRRSPQGGQVEIAAEAVGLNFRDVLNVLKMLPGKQMPLGGECAGRVVAVGEGVKNLRVGDEVLAFALGGFRSHVTVDEEYVAVKPATMSFEEAAAIPVVFLTAHYALQHLEQIAAGDTILIHAAAGGVGLATVQIALSVGAEVFATAGSPEKRDYLRSLGVKYVMDSRSVAFADQIMEQTQGRGVDFVLNSLSDEMIPKSLSVVRTGGTFFEIGKRDIWDDSRVAQFRPGVAYRVFDLATVASEQPALIQSMLQDLMKQFASGLLMPLKRMVFTASKVVEAFQTMARAKHIGKIVVTMKDAEVAGSNSRAGMLDPDGTYLITGGLGALGLCTARWMIERGARHIALAGRRPPTAAVSEIVAAMQQNGAKVALLQADISIHSEVSRLLNEIGGRMPPLRGIVHAAGVIADGVLLKLDWQRFRTVMAPKIDGAWNLHRLTQQVPLDIFMLFSSAASIIGWPSQGNYAAANSFLDALAHKRRLEGATALSINWGPWRDVGMASNLTGGRQQQFAAKGLGTISPVQGMAALDRIVGACGQIVALPVDWARFRNNWHGGIIRPLFESFAGTLSREASQQRSVRPAGGLRAILEQAPPGNRLAILMEQLERQAAQILGLAPGRRIEPLRPLQEIGLDSLMAVELRNALNALFEHPLSATLLFDFPTLEALGRYLADEVLCLDMGEAAASRPAVPEGAAVPASDLAILSDQEAEAMLVAELKRMEEK